MEQCLKSYSSEPERERFDSPLWPNLLDEKHSPVT